MIIVIDYDAGNTRNVMRALTKIGLESKLSSDAAEIRAADGLILPGVGAFPLAMQALEKRGLVEVIKAAVAKGKPLLGVCLGMQLLLESSEEHHYTKGFGFIPGSCKLIPSQSGFPVPHMGWNQLKVQQENALTKGINGEYVYFVHSYYTDVPNAYLDAVSQYSMTVPAIISNGNVFGAQFHPEKSGETGQEILLNFKEYVYANSTRN
ncbi:MULTISPECIES: imidazole glycerol phosphate synthase subunit HisH [unclassified Enterococcus]|uniref:imidazole glycerol phosphate synthase subunit HisH n=1 Tax=unclassified Enterococcus TaxID=2608891 RepID=UPI001556190A|nr:MULTISPECIES: imidazole glycerol phosphate synthase subunit HisH [unclassified Enterococcus]MBS7577246.1 imidazole glycerol phosphate synthase subunit HisH [Enterococcus sp. MMGLQ5-2]MBS7584661.1 imidazole glycerol phosphate synthase subunit HisH [Enterococcus sp. MMGLQ5-1]NPD12516.1 imidazole glycerol phosphate synthase subunit HisH [Enterococcus sp. MMGLQ5-1]NPD37080.1 imidazole glycerol phosphate synthase subunit HisH [Enterococcus sp. MMGLQ5-2]